jgi:DnaJ-class molecular chaperone
LISTECAQEYSDEEKEYKYEEYKEKECDSDTNDFNEKIVKQKIEACYQILGLEEGVDQKEISKTFRKRAKTCHPDKYPNDDQKNEDFKKINNAREVLVNYYLYKRGEISQKTFKNVLETST